MEYRCDWFKPHKGIFHDHLWVDISVTESEALVHFTHVRDPLASTGAVPPYVYSPHVRFLLLAHTRPETLLGGDVTYDPKMGFVHTVYGLWPVPWMVLRALSRNEIAGRATQEALHHLYWFCICSSALLRDWFAKQYPEFWKLQLTAFPELGGIEDAIQIHDDPGSP